MTFITTTISGTTFIIMTLFCTKISIIKFYGTTVSIMTLIRTTLIVMTLYRTTFCKMLLSITTKMTLGVTTFMTIVSSRTICEQLRQHNCTNIFKVYPAECHSAACHYDDCRGSNVFQSFVLLLIKFVIRASLGIV
jgi:hypothetical protein